MSTSEIFRALFRQLACFNSELHNKRIRGGHASCRVKIRQGGIKHPKTLGENRFDVVFLKPSLLMLFFE